MNMHAPSKSDHRESSDRYHAELIRDGNFRVSVCRDGIQWLFQRQGPGKAGVGGAWDTLGYCRQRATLERLWRELAGRAAPPAIAFLPERFIKR